MKIATFYLSTFLLSAFILLVSACQPIEQTKLEPKSAFQTASGQPVMQGTSLSFPQDHGIHQQQGIEWWYITANLESDAGETFGVQWTLFRTLMPSSVSSTWWDNNLYFAHFAMQYKQEHVAFERFSRANQTQITPSPFSAVIDDWQLSSINNDFLPLTLKASQSNADENSNQNYHIDLTLNNSPLTLHGDRGYSQKTASGHASYYFSYPFLNVTGNLTFAGKQYQVTGDAWYDREWSASLLDKSQLGWDWFSLVDSTGKKKGLMLFCIRGEQQSYQYCSGTHITTNGEATPIPKEDIKLTVLETVKLDNSDYPSKWQVSLPNTPKITIKTITKDSRNQLSIPYWEGRVKVSGGFNGKGYAELTGY